MDVLIEMVRAELNCSGSPLLTAPEIVSNGQ